MIRKEMMALFAGYLPNHALSFVTSAVPCTLVPNQAVGAPPPHFGSPRRSLSQIEKAEVNAARQEHPYVSPERRSARDRFVAAEKLRVQR